MLLLGGFHTMVDDVLAELDRRGHTGVRPVHEFALRAIDGGAESASELGRRLAVSKQAAAKTIAALEALGYVSREADPHDARRKRLRVTPLGFEVLRQGEAIFDELRESWARQIGAAELAALEAQLTKLVGDGAVRPDAPGWVAEDQG